MRHPYRLAAVLIALVGVGYLATLRPGHEWGDDFGLYVQHARNLAEGRPYADTGYIYNPHFPSLSPRTYPPGLPLLLAPVYRVFGLNLVAMKVELTLLFVAFLAVLYAGWRKELPAPCLIATLLFLGLNPYLWDFKDRILSEIPYLLFSFLALWLLREMDEGGRSAPGRAMLAVAAGLACYLSCATRSVGIVLVPALLLQQLLARRGLGWPCLLALAVFAAGMLGQRALLPPDGSYLDQLTFSPELFAGNLASLVKAMGLFLDNGHDDRLRIALYLALSALALVGLIDRWRHRLTAAETYTVLYAAAVIVWPSAAWNPRFLVPVLPLYLLYVWHGARRLAPLAGGRLAPVLGTSLAVAVLASYAAWYTRPQEHPSPEGITKPEAVALFDFVTGRTRADDVFLFQKPRALALLTGRRASALHRPHDDADLWSYLDEIGATHVIVGRPFPQNRAVLEPFVARNARRFDEVFANADFTVYRIRGRPAGEAARADPDPWR